MFAFRQKTVRNMIAMLAVISTLSPVALAKGKGPWEEHADAARNAMNQGDYESAANLLKDAMNDTRKFKDDDVRLGSTYYMMGQLNIRQQNYSLAKEYFERALSVQQKLLGAESLESADSLYGIALCDQQLGDHLGAEIFLKRVHEIWRKKLGPNDPKLISILPSMAAYLAMKNDFGSAETYYKQLVNIAQSNGNQMQLGSYMNLLATTLGNEGKVSEARDYASRALDIMKKSSDSAIAIDSAQDNLHIIESKLGIKGTDRIAQSAAGSQESSEEAAKQKAERDRLLAEQAKLKAEQERLAAEARRKEEAAKLAAEETKRQIEASKIAAAKARADAEAQLSAEKTKVEAERKAAEEKLRLAEKTKAEAERQAAEARALAEKARIAVQEKEKQLPQERVRITEKNASEDKSANDSGPKPWKTDRVIKKPSQDKSQQWGKVRYLADGKLITAEEYKALLLANEAYDAMREDKYRLAADILNKALDICPELPSAHTNLGLALARLGQGDDAIEHLRLAISLDPSRSAPWVNLASSFQSNGRLNDCLETYKEYLRRFPNDSLAGKARDLVKHLQNEANEQAAVERTLTASGSSTNDYFPYTTASGTVKWADSKIPVKVYIASGARVPGYKPEYQGLISDAFKSWSAASGDRMKFDFVNRVEGADIDCLFTNDYSQVNSPAEGGEAQVSWGQNGIEHVKVVILTADPTPDSPLTRNQVQAVCLHEIGHAIGLIGHSPKPSDVMYCSMPSADTKVAISPRDSGTIKHLYASDVQIALKPRVKTFDPGDKNSVNNEGVELMSAHAYAQAIEKFEAALKLDPNYDLAKENLSRAYNSYAIDLASKGKEQDAETWMQKAMRLKDSIRSLTLKLTTMNNYAQILHRLRRDSEAAKLEAEAKSLKGKEAAP